MSRLGLRARLSVALAVVAVGAVVLATVLANVGLSRQLDATAERRLDDVAAHVAEVAAEVYARQGGWTRAARTELGHLAAIDGLRVTVGGGAAADGAGRAVPVIVGGRTVGRLHVVPVDAEAFTAADRDLHRRLNRLHLIAGLLGGVLGIVAAFLLAGPLTRPLRRMTVGARRMEQGALDTRVEPGGGRELEQLGFALNRLAQTLQREETLRREATADLAHELRTPLTGILSRIEAAQDGVLADAEANLDAMHREAQRLSTLIDDLGRLADAQQFRLSAAAETVSLDALVTDRVAAWAGKTAGVRVVTEVEQARVHGDRHRLEQVVENLLSNAVRYTDAGGVVTLRTGRGPDGVILEVRDTGVGISAAEIPHVFERFWRSDKSRTRASGGAGIGLAIVQELIRAHHGHVEVTSWPGEGSTFTVRLPDADRAVAPGG